MYAMWDEFFVQYNANGKIILADGMKEQDTGSYAYEKKDLPTDRIRYITYGVLFRTGIGH